MISCLKGWVENMDCADSRLNSSRKKGALDLMVSSISASMRSRSSGVKGRSTSKS